MDEPRLSLHTKELKQKREIPYRKNLHAKKSHQETPTKVIVVAELFGRSSNRKTADLLRKQLRQKFAAENQRRGVEKDIDKKMIWLRNVNRQKQRKQLQTAKRPPYFPPTREGKGRHGLGANRQLATVCWWGNGE